MDGTAISDIFPKTTSQFYPFSAFPSARVQLRWHPCCWLRLCYLHMHIIIFVSLSSHFISVYLFWSRESCTPRMCECVPGFRPVPAPFFFFLIYANKWKISQKKLLNAILVCLWIRILTLILILFLFRIRIRNADAYADADAECGVSQCADAF